MSQHVACFYSGGSSITIVYLLLSFINLICSCSSAKLLLLLAQVLPKLKLFVVAGDVQSLLETYDRDRRVLPPPVVPWKWGWTKSAETWNGRIAMLAIVVILMLEVTTGHGVLNHWPYDEWTMN